MRLSENRLLAWLVLAICVVGSIFGLGGAGLKREYNELLNEFYSGSEPDDTARYSMDAYLDRAAECAQIMVSEALLYLGSELEPAFKAQSAIDFILDDSSLDTRYEGYAQLQKLSDSLYNAMYGAELTAQQRVNFKRAYDDFWGSDKYIRKDPYREKAANFNASLKQFPASLIASLYGIRELNSFGA